jgi:hypothetical protein
MNGGTKMIFNDLIKVLTFTNMDYTRNIRVYLVTETDRITGVREELPLGEAINKFGECELFCLHNYNGYSTFNDMSVSLVIKQ